MKPADLPAERTEIHYGVLRDSGTHSFHLGSPEDARAYAEMEGGTPVMRTTHERWEVIA